MQELINSITTLKEYILCTLILVFLCYLMLQIQQRRAEKKEAYISWKHIFFVLDGKGLTCLAINFSMLCFIISCCFRFQSLNIVHVIFFLLHLLLAMVCSAQLKLFGYMLLNAILFGGALVVMNMLYQYMVLIHEPTQLIVIYLCSGICISLYACYVFFYELYLLMKGRKVTYA